MRPQSRAFAAATSAAFQTSARRHTESDPAARAARLAAVEKRLLAGGTDMSRLEIRVATDSAACATLPRMFDPKELVEGCRAAVKGPDAERTVRELLTEAIADPGAVARAFGDVLHAGPVALYRAPDLTVLNFAWAPWMCFKPHNHNMWSVVGIYFGREDNVFWRRVGGGIEAAGARSIGTGEVAFLGRDTIHSVTNPIGKFTRAIHVYGGDFFAPEVPRSEWQPETLTERPWDMTDTLRLFAEAEARSRSG